MHTRPHGAPRFRRLEFEDLNASLSQGVQDFLRTPLHDLFFASFFVFSGLAMSWITYATGHTFWLVLAVLGFPLVGSFAALGFYETSRRRAEGVPLDFGEIIGVVWSHKGGQLPLLAVIIVVVFLFWFFLGHMIFALFLGLAPMTNISTSLEVLLTPNGLAMIALGTAVGAVFATVIFAMSVLGIPMLLDRDVDFMTAMIGSMAAVRASPVLFLLWGLFIAVVTLASMTPLFLGLFFAMPVLGHATWHLYKRLAG